MEASLQRSSACQKTFLDELSAAVDLPLLKFLQRLPSPGAALVAVALELAELTPVHWT